VIEEH